MPKRSAISFRVGSFADKPSPLRFFNFVSTGTRGTGVGKISDRGFTFTFG
jgi:hypothetical protein